MQAVTLLRALHCEVASARSFAPPDGRGRPSLRGFVPVRSVDAAIFLRVLCGTSACFAVKCFRSVSNQTSSSKFKKKVVTIRRIQGFSFHDCLPRLNCRGLSPPPLRLRTRFPGRNRGNHVLSKTHCVAGNLGLCCRKRAGTGFCGRRSRDRKSVV